MNTPAPEDCARDEQGRFKPGASGNPTGRPVGLPYFRLLEAAEAAGAQVVVMVPPRVAPTRRSRRGPSWRE